MIESGLDRFDVIAVLTLKEGDERARVRGDHRRSARRRAGSIENLTVPRSFETRRNVSPAATSRKPWRTVAVIPCPDDRCARSSNSSGTYRVILRSAIRPIYQHLCWHRCRNKPPKNTEHRRDTRD